MLEKRYNELKKEIIEMEYDFLNDMQKKAVFTVNGPLLILAGAGSGKTTVLVNRIGHLLEYGNAYYEDTFTPIIDEDDLDFLQDYIDQKHDNKERVLSLIGARTPNPWNVLAITFTNKAANELKERLEKRLGDMGSSVASGTFHSICVRILRREIENLGYTSSFTIYDTDDSIRVIKDCMESLGMDTKMFAPKAILSQISNQKNSSIKPEQMLQESGSDFRLKKIAEVYESYQKRLKNANAVDFDDIIMLTVELFENFPDVLEHYQNLYKYILVDEYQDTNQIQYKLVSLLSKKHKNLCVVGDDDQSIYKFRGATIENILSFENQFEDAVVIRLEQNYRSTQSILDTANQVIKNNIGRKGKNLWTKNGQGEKITVFRGKTDYEESGFVGQEIENSVARGRHFSDHAVLYRMNSQSNTIERELVRRGIAYRIVGGTKFFDRKEIKDILAYFHVMENPSDSVRLKRIINEPKRGIGAATIKAVEEISLQTGVSMFEIMKTSDTYSVLAKKSKSLIEFVNMIEELSDISLTMDLEDVLDEVMDKTGYNLYLSAQGVEGRVRLENIEELKSNLVKYSQENEEPSLSGFLEEVSLFTDLDNMNDSDDKVTLMTLHSAKGLEFPVVFIVGMENGIFPGYASLQSDEELEEERRLAYVGITRAKEKLYVTNAYERMMFGKKSINDPSMFIKEMMSDVVEVKDNTLTLFNKPQVSRQEIRKPLQKEYASVGTKASAPKADINYTVGDRVSHKVFGEGKVVAMTPMGGDIMVEILFDKVGTKKLMANFAKVNKI